MSQTERQNNEIFREKYFYDTKEFIGKDRKATTRDSIKLW